MKEPLLYLKLILAFLILPFSVNGQEKKAFLLKKITPSEGISSYYITKIIRDFHGFLWVGTQEGLERFDGRNFLQFSRNADDSHRLGGSFVEDLLEDHKRKLIWVVTSYGDICAIDINTGRIKKRITRDSNGRKLSDNWIRCICLQGNRLWIGGLGGLRVYDIESERYLLVKNGLDISRGVYNIARLWCDLPGRIWAFCDGDGVRSFHIGSDSLQAVFPGELRSSSNIRKLRFWDITIHDRLLYVSTSWGLRVFNPANYPVRVEPFPTQTIMDTAEIFCSAFSSAGTVYFATAGHFYSYDLFRKKLFMCQDENKEEDDWFGYTYDTYFDSVSQMMWIGTQAGLGNFSLKKKAFTPFYRSTGSEVKIKHAYCLLPEKKEALYCGDENGLFRIDTRTKEIRQLDNASTNLLLFRDSSQNVFLSNKKGLFILKNNKLRLTHVAFPALKPLESDQLNCGIQFNDSILLFGSVIQKGLSVWNKRTGRLDVYHKDSALHPIKGLSIIDNIYKSSSGTVYILTEKAIIEFNPLNGKYITHVLVNTREDSNFSNYMDMCEASGSYWFATYGQGLIETDLDFRIKRIASSRDGLCNDCLYRVFPYHDSCIIATTNNGLAIIRCGDLSVKNFYQSDGLHSNGFEQLCGFQHNDSIYAGGVNGFTIIDPGSYARNTIAPLFYFSDITIKTRQKTLDTCNLELGQLKIPNDVVQTTVHFSGINYLNSLRTHFSYRIKEINNDWLSTGDDNFVNLIGLAPGDYTIEAKAVNEDGIWSNPKELKLTFLPKWYQTLLFKLLVIAAIAALLYAFYRYRIGQIKKQQQIRKDIASDLHDDIGSTLNTVKIFTHLAKREQQKEEHLTRIEESLTQATMGLRDMIWVLDDSLDTIKELAERIKKFAIPVTQVNHIHFECIVAEDIANLVIPKTVKRNLLLIAKESINNSLKYSECGNLRVSLQLENTKLLLSIRDDGKGFDVDDPAIGNGLNNIQRRAKQIRFAALIISSPDQGTLIEITGC